MALSRSYTKESFINIIDNSSKDLSATTKIEKLESGNESSSVDSMGLSVQSDAYLSAHQIFQSCAWMTLLWFVIKTFHSLSSFLRQSLITNSNTHHHHIFTGLLCSFVGC